MTIRPLLYALAVLACAGATAQECSGGTAGGMDATGNQCNGPTAAEQPADASAAAAQANLAQALAEYRVGHFTAAAEYFRRAAEQGDGRSAEALALMYRFGPRLYGSGFAADPQRASLWADRAAQARLRLIVAGAP